MTTPSRVLIADFLDDAEVETPILAGSAEITLARAWTEQELAPHLPTTDLIILYHDIPHLGEASFAQAPRCRGVVRAGVGYNNVDLHAAGSRGIVVCNVPDYGTEEVADHALAMLLAIARHLPAADASIRRGKWDFRVVGDSPRLRGKRLGLVGCGRIGTATALRAKAFGLEVLFHDPLAVPGLDKALGIRRVDHLDELLAQSHFVSLHCYLDDSTRHLIDARALALMRPESILINTARGGVIDTEALLAALDSGHLLGAGLDVLEVEPLADERLRRHPRVLLSPHSAFFSREGFVELRTKTAEEARRILLGRPPRCPVNAEMLVPSSTAPAG